MNKQIAHLQNLKVIIYEKNMIAKKLLQINIIYGNIEEGIIEEKCL